MKNNFPIETTWLKPQRLLGCRLLTMIALALRYQLDRKIWPRKSLWWLRLVLVFYPQWWSMCIPDERGECLRWVLERLGPISIKFGQMLSLQRDKLPGDVITALEKLQDRVEPFASSQAIELIERSLGDSVENLFSRFDEIPLAAASIAQVHAAQLPDGRDVVVKVLRPDIHLWARCDIKVLYRLAYWLSRRLKGSHRKRPKAMVAEFEKHLYRELDLRYEAAHANCLRSHFESTNLLYVPFVYWPYVRSDVLVLERVSGLALTDNDGLSRRGLNRQHLAAMGVEIFLKQVFEHCFFHADMHPGNVWIADQPSPQYVVVDFGIMGSISSKDQYYLAANLLALFKRDYRRVAQLHRRAGWIADDAHEVDFESTLRALVEPIVSQPLSKMSLADLLLGLFKAMGRFQVTVQSQLLLLQKTLVSVEALGRQLDPQLNVWETARPFLECWMREHYGINRFLTRIFHQSL